MILLFDIGNTRTKYQLMTNDAPSTTDYCSNNDISRNWLMNNFNSVSEIILSNVNAPELTDTITDWANDKSIPLTVIEVTSEAFGVNCGYEEPSQLGVDRWVVALAAAKLYPAEDCIVVDSGTATTIDIIKQGKHFAGGWIIPGIDLMVESLLGATNKITIDRKKQFSEHFGINTNSAVFNGAFIATLSTIKESIEQLTYQPQAPKVIVTGGYGELLSENLFVECVFIDDLIFQGMLRFSQTLPSSDTSVGKKTANK